MEDAEKWPKFPEPVRPCFEKAWQSVALLNSVWTVYLDLFGKPENLVVLNKTAPAAFRIIEKSLRTEMAMAFSRLLDPAQQGKYKNLSLEHLVQELRPHVGDTKYNMLKIQLQEIETQCNPILESRNKVYGHADLKTALHYHENPLPGIKRSTIEKALGLICDFMNVIQMHFQGGVTVFDNPVLFGSGEHLVEILKKQLQNHEEERKRRLGESNR